MKFLKTNLDAKVRNLPHFKGEALLPAFETVANSIEAIYRQTQSRKTQLHQ